MTREEAVNDLNVIKEFFEQESGAYPVSLEYAIEVLKNELSADRPQGEWTKEGCAKGSEMCNQCGFVQFEGRVDNFCPNCGARMKGADDE